MLTKKLTYLIGITAILISLITWTLDLSHLVEICIYCRIERTIIGILGIIILLPLPRDLQNYFSLVFGFFGGSVVSHHIFLLIDYHTYHLEFLLALCALLIIVALVYLTVKLQKLR